MGDPMNERDTLRIDGNGRLTIGGADCVALARQFGTPLYCLDEDHIRNMMRAYRDTLAREYEGGGIVLYASKALCCKAMYLIARAEGIGADVVSGGELYTAAEAGFPAELLYFHGNNKTPEEIGQALDRRVGTFVIDSELEAERLEEQAARRHMTQKVLLRINPGVEAHTHAYIQTAKTDSKFGFSVQDGTAARMIGLLLCKPHLHLAGIHCHIGSQIFEKQSFAVAAEKCLAFLAECRRTLGFEAEELNLGGGFGIWYSDGDNMRDAAAYADDLRALIYAVKKGCAAHGLRLPRLVVEPGRSIVGEAGITLYTAGAVKEIPGVRTYLAVDGGMFENPRYALYQAKYTALVADRAAEPPTRLYALAGKCCESGDLIGVDMPLPEVHPGDILAVLSTGAYNYSMASHYNRNLIPPVVLVKDGAADYIVRPETYEDLVRRDVLPERLR